MHKGFQVNEADTYFPFVELSLKFVPPHKGQG